MLILTVGVVNGAGWALCQNWQWADASFRKGRSVQFLALLGIVRRTAASASLTGSRISSSIAGCRTKNGPSWRRSSRSKGRSSNGCWCFSALTYYAYIAPLAVAVTADNSAASSPGSFRGIRTYIPGQWATL